MGDGRLSLEAELERSGSREFDILVLDAFNSDAIPLHLLPMTVILTVLFSVVALQEGLTVLFHWGDQIGLMLEIRSREALSWHGASRVGPSLGMFFNSTFAFGVIGGYIGALLFFFHQRHVGLKSN